MKSLSELIHVVRRPGDHEYGCDACTDTPGFLEKKTSYDLQRPQYTQQMNVFCACVTGQNLLNRLIRGDEPPRTEEQRMEATRQLIASCYPRQGIPPNMLDYTLQGWVSAFKLRHVWQPILELAQEGSVGGKRGILLHGPTGAGKTGALTPLYKSLKDKGHPSLWMTLADIILSASPLIEKDKTMISQRMHLLKSVDVLFVDEFIMPDQDRRELRINDIVFPILKARHENRRTTLMTTNVTLEEMRRHTGEALYRRISELCLAIEVKPVSQMEWIEA